MWKHIDTMAHNSCAIQITLLIHFQRCFITSISMLFNLEAKWMFVQEQSKILTVVLEIEFRNCRQMKLAFYMSMILYKMEKLWLMLKKKPFWLLNLPRLFCQEIPLCLIWCLRVKYLYKFVEVEGTIKKGLICR